MKILEDLIASLNLNSGIRDIRQGVFQTAVFTRGCGLASTPHDTDSIHGHSKNPVKNSGELLNSDMLTLVNMSKSDSMLEAAIGLAAINSLLDVDLTRCRELNAADLIKNKGEGRKVAIIGHFPFVPQLKNITKKLWVIEKNPVDDDYPEEEAEKILPEADVIGITGVTLINHTFDKLMEYCRTDAFVVMLGGTTPLSPVMFDYGINAVSGTLVINPDSVLNCVSQGATFRQIKGIRLLTME